MRNRKLKLTLLTLLPGILFFLAWPPRDLFFLSFVGFVPLLLLEKEMRGRKGFWLLSYFSLLLWNILTTWWVWYASAGGSIAMLLANTALMTLPWLGYKKSVETFGQRKAYLVLISLWLSFEYLHLNWEITWPWLTLGNVFAKHNFTVQWYEFTGTLGGSFWVLLTNVVIYKAVNQPKKWIMAGLTIVLPIVFSLGLKQYRVSHQPTNNGYEALIIQPNIDPYKKFSSGEEVPNLEKMLFQAEALISDSTRYVVMPETAVVEYVDEDNPYLSRSIVLLKDFVKRHPQIELVTGVSTYNFYAPSEKRSPTARKTNFNEYYESYNTALHMDSSGSIELYHKSKLVPGVEKMPYPQIFGFLEKMSIDMGGISGSLGSDKEPKVFGSQNTKVAPLICYESVFPGFVAQFVRKGADALFVITNDGWWSNTDGYKQHMYYACLRAIENRREVIRSANTGISCHINAYGSITQRTEWWKEDALKVTIKTQQRQTLFSRTGDYLGRIASFIGIFYILGLFVKRRIKE